MVFHNQNEPLFYKYDLRETMENQISGISDKVEQINRDQFLSASEDHLHEYIYSESEIEPITLHEDKTNFEQEEIKVDVSNDPMRGGNIFGHSGPLLVPGIRVTVSIPFDGDPNLWFMQPNTFDCNPPRGNIKDNYFQMAFELPSDKDQAEIRTRYERTVEGVKRYLSFQDSQIKSHNQKLSSEIYDAIRARRERLKKHEGLSDILGIPLKPREGAPKIQPIEVKRKLVRPLPSVPKHGYKPEPGLLDENFEHILSVIRHEGRTFESTPKTFHVHDEEDLRSIIMAHLNGHYEGSATGETFRGKGKTDIRIEDQERAAFVAECKVWRGKGEIIQAINQLLGYLIWRDCKSCIIIFNKNNAKFSELLQKAPEAFESHPKFLEKIECKHDGEWRYKFSAEDDDGREIIIHIFLFNLFVK